MPSQRDQSTISPLRWAFPTGSLPATRNPRWEPKTVRLRLKRDQTISVIELAQTRRTPGQRHVQTETGNQAPRGYSRKGQRSPRCNRGRTRAARGILPAHKNPGTIRSVTRHAATEDPRRQHRRHVSLYQNCGGVRLLCDPANKHLLVRIDHHNAALAHPHTAGGYAWNEKWDRVGRNECPKRRWRCSRSPGLSHGPSHEASHSRVFSSPDKGKASTSRQKLPRIRLSRE